MTLEQFVEHRNYAPWDLSDYADEIKKITDCKELTDAAQKYLESEKNLLDLMKKHNIKQG